MIIGNWPILIRVFDHVIMNPNEYNQAFYYDDCGSQRCIAGWTTAFGGYPDYPGDGACVMSPVGDKIEVGDAALEILAVADESWNNVSEALFHGQARWPRILDALARLAALDGITLSPTIIAEMRKQSLDTELY